MIKKVWDKIEFFFSAIGGAVLAVMTIWLFADMVGRYVFHHPLPSTLEIGEEFFMIAVTYLGMAITQKHREHVRVDAVLAIMPPKARFVTEKLADVLMFVTMLMFTKHAWDQVLYAIKINSVSRSNLAYPLAPSYFILCFGWALTTIRCLFQIFERAPKEETKEADAK